MTGMKSLIERLEALTGPDYDIDSEIAKMQGWGYSRRDGTGYWGWTRPNMPYHYNVLPPAYTSSIDAAMTLVPEGRGWVIGWGQITPNEPMAGAQITAYDVFAGYDVANDAIAEAEASTPAIALCIASLKAIGNSHD